MSEISKEEQEDIERMIKENLDNNPLNILPKLYIREEMFEACYDMYCICNPVREVSGDIREHIREWFDKKFPI